MLQYKSQNEAKIISATSRWRLERVLLILVLIYYIADCQVASAIGVASIRRHILGGKSDKSLDERVDNPASVDTTEKQSTKSEMTDLLVSAIHDDDTDRVQWLLSNHVSASGVDSKGTTPLIEAVKVRNVKVIDLLLQAGANVHETSNSYLHGHPLLMAIFLDEKEIFLQLLPHYEKADFSHKGWSPLGEAAFYGRSSMVAILLMKGADPNFDIDHKETALHKAVYVDDDAHKDIAKLLVYGGADVSHEDDKGNTPIDTARKHGNYELAQLLKRDLQ